MKRLSRPRRRGGGPRDLEPRRSGPDVRPMERLRTVARLRSGTGPALPILLALSGCDPADAKDTRLDAGAADRGIAAFRAAPAGLRYSMAQAVERPCAGLEPAEEDRRGRPPGRFPTTDAVTPPPPGLDPAGALAARIKAAPGDPVHGRRAP